MPLQIASLTKSSQPASRREIYYTVAPVYWDEIAVIMILQPRVAIRVLTISPASLLQKYACHSVSL